MAVGNDSVLEVADLKTFWTNASDERKSASVKIRPAPKDLAASSAEMRAYSQ